MLPPGPNSIPGGQIQALPSSEGTNPLLESQRQRPPFRTNPSSTGHRTQFPWLSR